MDKTYHEQSEVVRIFLPDDKGKLVLMYGRKSIENTKKEKGDEEAQGT